MSTYPWDELGLAGRTHRDGILAAFDERAARAKANSDAVALDRLEQARDMALRQARSSTRSNIKNSILWLVLLALSIVGGRAVGAPWLWLLMLVVPMGLALTKSLPVAKRVRWSLASIALLYLVGLGLEWGWTWISATPSVVHAPAP